MFNEFGFPILNQGNYFLSELEKLYLFVLIRGKTIPSGCPYYQAHSRRCHNNSMEYFINLVSIAFILE